MKNKYFVNFFRQSEYEIVYTLFIYDKDKTNYLNLSKLARLVNKEFNRSFVVLTHSKVKNLEDLGLVNIIPKGRSKLIFLTQKGFEVGLSLCEIKDRIK
jgi:hypothetical protein